MLDEISNGMKESKNNNDKYQLITTTICNFYFPIVSQLFISANYISTTKRNKTFF